jgi:hypothetical protein
MGIAGHNTSAHSIRHPRTKFKMAAMVAILVYPEAPFSEKYRRLFLAIIQKPTVYRDVGCTE